MDAIEGYIKPREIDLVVRMGEITTSEDPSTVTCDQCFTHPLEQSLTFRTTAPERQYDLCANCTRQTVKIKLFKGKEVRPMLVAALGLVLLASGAYAEAKEVENKFILVDPPAPRETQDPGLREAIRQFGPDFMKGSFMAASNLVRPDTLVGGSPLGRAPIPQERIDATLKAQLEEATQQKKPVDVQTLLKQIQLPEHAFVTNMMVPNIRLERKYTQGSTDESISEADTSAEGNADSFETHRSPRVDPQLLIPHELLFQTQMMVPNVRVEQDHKNLPIRRTVPVAEAPEKDKVDSLNPPPPSLSQRIQKMLLEDRALSLMEVENLQCSPSGHNCPPQLPCGEDIGCKKLLAELNSSLQQEDKVAPGTFSATRRRLLGNMKEVEEKLLQSTQELLQRMEIPKADESHLHKQDQGFTFPTVPHADLPIKKPSGRLMTHEHHHLTLMVTDNILPLMQQQDNSRRFKNVALGPPGFIDEEDGRRSRDIDRLLREVADPATSPNTQTDQ